MILALTSPPPPSALLARLILIFLVSLLYILSHSLTLLTVRIKHAFVERLPIRDLLFLLESVTWDYGGALAEVALVELPD